MAYNKDLKRDLKCFTEIAKPTTHTVSAFNRHSAIGEATMCWIPPKNRSQLDIHKANRQNREERIGISYAHKDSPRHE